MSRTWALLCLLAGPACSATPSTPPRPGLGPDLVSALITYEDVELGEITSDVIVNGFKVGEVDIEDFERTRAGVGVRFGPREIGGYAGILVEEFGDVFDLYGVGVGGNGQFPFAGSEDQGELFVDYQLAMNLLAGDGDVPVFDANTGARIGEVDQDLAYVEFAGRAGIGVDFHGVQPMAGVVFSLLGGEFDAGFGRDADIEGANAGVYAGVGLDFHRIQGRVEYRAGDIDGFAVMFGVRF